MNCPAYETLARHVDGALPPSEEPRVAEHVLECTRCRHEVETLEGMDGALKDGRTWLGPSRCLTPRDLLLALSGGEPLLHVQQHVHQCAPCQGELTGLSDALLLHERGENERVSTGLKARLRRVGALGMDGAADVSSSTVAETAPGFLRRPEPVKLPSSAGSSGTSKRASRRMSSARTSGSGRASGSTRRRASVKLAPIVRGPSAFGPAWAWVTMSAAAMVLVALAIALSPARDGRDTARVPTPDPTTRRPGATPGNGPKGPLVSDAMSRRGSGPGSTSHGSETGSSTEPGVDSTYPLPAELADALPPAEPGESIEEPAFEPARPTDEPPAVAPAAGSVVRPLPGVDAAPEDAPTPPSQPTGAGNAAPAAPIIDDGGQVQLALSRLSGAVALVRASGGDAAQGLSRGQGTLMLRPGDRLRTKAGAGGGAFLSLEDGVYEMCLDQGTEIVVRATEGGPVIGLESGRLLAEVTAMPWDKRFVVATAQGTFSVHGTVFGVETDDQSSRLLVTEGTVEAHSQHGKVDVPAGQSVGIANGGAPEARPADFARLAWARQWQVRREVLYTASFEDARNLNGFQGDLVTDRTWRGSAGALRLGSAGDNRFWGLLASAPARRLRAFRAAPDLYVQFSIWSEKATHVLFETLNEPQNKEFKRGLPDAPAGRWKTYTVPVMELTTYFDPGKHPIREGDLLLDLEIYAGEPGESFKVVIDDVQVFRKIYD